MVRYMDSTTPTPSLSWSRERLMDELSRAKFREEELRTRVAELEAQQGEPTGTEWGVRYPTGTDVLVRDEREAWERASVRPGRSVLTRTAPGPWRVAS